ncbi:MAG: hypothetical protein ACE5Z5_06920 [Candidatus Bathyarchaeia archaeon]
MSVNDFRIVPHKDSVPPIVGSYRLFAPKINQNQPRELVLMEAVLERDRRIEQLEERLAKLEKRVAEMKESP